MNAVDSDAVTTFAEAVGVIGPVAAEGGRTRWDVGGQLAGDVRLVRAPTGIVEYHPEEMMVRVGAGTPVAELVDVLSRTGQRVALPERGGTVGGALAVGEDHLDVMARGRVRDSLLAATYVSADGKVIHAGGATVKNVSGFDLPRLLVGSFGTLGLLAEVVLRTNPIPPATRWIAADGADPFAAFNDLYRPAAILWDGSLTWIHLEGHGDDVESLHHAGRRFGDFREVDRPPVLPTCRWTTTPRALREIMTSRCGDFVASVGVGTVFSQRPPSPGLPPEPDQSTNAGARRALSARLKAAFDPLGRLAPGRQVTS